MNSNKDSVVQCLISAGYFLSTVCTIFIALAIYGRSLNMAMFALESFLIMGVIVISASIVYNCDDYGDVPFLVNIVCFVVLAIEYFIMVVGCGIFNIVKWIFIFPGTAFSFVIDLFVKAFYKKGDDSDEKIE